MITNYYDVILLISLVLTIIYVFIWRKHFDVHITVMYVLVCVSNLGFALFSHAVNLEEALASYKLTYVSGCFSMLNLMLVIFSLCDLRLNRWLKVAMMSLSAVVFMSALSIGRTDIFYKSVSFVKTGNTVSLIKEYGIMHHVFTCMVILYFALSVAAVIYSFFRKNQVSRKLLVLLFIPLAISVAIYFTPFRYIRGVEVMPAVFDLALLNYLLIVRRIALYDITDTAIDSLVRKGDTGFISFDNRLNYLASNDTARTIFPELNNLMVDLPADRNSAINETALYWIRRFQADNSNNTASFTKEDKIYKITVRELYDGHRMCGYQLYINDDTKNQQYINLINRFNDELKSEVAQKTEHIIEMHDNLILSMATMVESRDNSTGGHIRRTSEGVRILIDEIRKNPSYDLSDEFCQDLIKAAPMHDLGKIAVDDVVLRKPGRFTPEEFEIMKKHAAEGARIVHEILKGTDDQKFREIAENVAHYHHERWDGSGYPEKLKGEQIPLEARIMAIADVYDALVSKRVYKEKMSFETANAIIMEGMGTQFDPALKEVYEHARPLLEAYYSSVDAA